MQLPGLCGCSSVCLLINGGSCRLHSVPDSPHEPDPEPYEPTPPRLIPLDEVSASSACMWNPSLQSADCCLILASWQDSSSVDDGYMESMDTSPQPSSAAASTESSKLPPVLANLMGSLGSGRSPQTQATPSNTSAPTVNVQELLTSIMVSGWRTDCCQQGLCRVVFRVTCDPGDHFLSDHPGCAEQSVPRGPDQAARFL